MANYTVSLHIEVLECSSKEVAAEIFMDSLRDTLSSGDLVVQVRHDATGDTDVFRLENEPGARWMWTVKEQIKEDGEE